MPCLSQNNFVPELPKEEPDLIYLCFPNNPTGAGISKENLQRFVDYARKIGAVILMMPLMKLIFPIRICLIAFMNAKGQESVPLSFGAFPKTQVSPVFA